MADVELGTLCYYKTEIDTKLSTEQTRVNSELAAKVNATAVGSPAGVAKLDVYGKVEGIQLPFASVVESGDETNNTTIMTPQRVLYQIEQNAITRSEIGAANGVAPLGADGLVPASKLPPYRTVATYVRSLLSDMYALPSRYTILAGDRCIVTSEVTGTLNGEYVAQVNTPSSGDWLQLPTLSAVTSVNGMTGNVSVTTTTQGDLNSLAIADLDDEVYNITASVEDIQTIIDKTAINIDNIIGAGTYHVTTGLPYGLASAILKVMVDERSVLNTGRVQYLMDEVGGNYAARTTTNSGTTWSAWVRVEADTSSKWYDFEPQTVTPTSVEGRMWYDDNSGYMKYHTSIAQQPLVVGQHLVNTVHNNSGATIAKGTPVRYSGVVIAGNPTVAKADASSFDTYRGYGVAAYEIPNGGTGTVLQVGVLDNVDLSTFDTGEIAYVAEGGGMTHIKPDRGYVVGVVLDATASGKLYVYGRDVTSNPIATGMMKDSGSVHALTAVVQNLVDYDTDTKKFITTDKALGTFTAQYAGNYDVEVMVDGYSNVAGREVVLGVLVDDVMSTEYGFACNVGASNRGSASFKYRVAVGVGETIKLSIKADGNCNYSVNMLQFVVTSEVLGV